MSSTAHPTRHHPSGIHPLRARIVSRIIHHHSHCFPFFMLTCVCGCEWLINWFVPSRLVVWFDFTSDWLIDSFIQKRSKLGRMCSIIVVFARGTHRWMERYRWTDNCPPRNWTRLFFEFQLIEFVNRMFLLLYKFIILSPTEPPF